RHQAPFAERRADCLHCAVHFRPPPPRRQTVRITIRMGRTANAGKADFARGQMIARCSFLETLHSAQAPCLSNLRPIYRRSSRINCESRVLSRRATRLPPCYYIQPEQAAFALARDLQTPAARSRPACAGHGRGGAARQGGSFARMFLVKKLSSEAHP